MTTIAVTQADIDEAMRLEKESHERATGEPMAVLPYDRCPVAIAATRAFGTPMRVWTDEDPDDAGDEPHTLQLHYKSRGFDKSADISLPGEVVERVNRYDIERWMEPFEFEVPS